MPTYLLSVATNGLEVRYGELLKTHSAYAKAHGYRHILITKPKIRLNATESAWLRIPIMKELVKRGPVFYVDADAEIKPGAPPIETVQIPGKKVYMARGNSGYFNSGVMYCIDCPDFFEKILAYAARHVPKAYRTAYENGHIIHISRTYPDVHELDILWNNTRDVALDDYVRHYTNKLLYLRPADPAAAAPTPSDPHAGTIRGHFETWLRRKEAQASFLLMRGGVLRFRFKARMELLGAEVLSEFDLG